MKFLIGTQNTQKVATAKKVIAAVLKLGEVDLEGMDVPSGFGETPIDSETKSGADNRAQALIDNHACDYAIGIESGLVERYGDLYEEAWCSIRTKDAVFYGYSSGLKVPDIITNKMKKHNMEHFEVLRTDEIRALLTVKAGKDTWGNYSAHMISRQVSFEESLRNALIQAFASEDSMYSK